MNDLLTDYLTTLGAPGALLERATDLIRQYDDLLPEDIGAWFVSEYRDDADQRTFESLWLFTPSFAMEAKLLGTDEDHFEFLAFGSEVKHLVVDKRAFDLQAATPASRMTVQVWFGERRYGVMRATGDNCVALAEILRSVLLPTAAPERPAGTLPG